MLSSLYFAKITLKSKFHKKPSDLNFPFEVSSTLIIHDRVSVTHLFCCHALSSPWHPWVYMAQCLLGTTIASATLKGVPSTHLRVVEYFNTENYLQQHTFPAFTSLILKCPNCLFPTYHPIPAPKPAPSSHETERRAVSPLPMSGSNVGHCGGGDRGILLEIFKSHHGKNTYEINLQDHLDE